MATHPSYYLVATTGHPNYGDELIASTWLKHLARVAPEAEVWMDCPNPGPTAVMLRNLHPRVQFTDTLWRLCWTAPSEEPWEVATFVRNAINSPGMTPHLVAGIELAARADIMHVIGGGFVNRIWPHHIGLLAAAVTAVRRSGGRAVMTGQGLWPVAEHASALLRSIVSQFEIIDVRDEPSAELLESTGEVSKTGDDLFFGIDDDLYRSDDLREYMVCLQSDLLDMPLPALAGFLLDTLRAWDVRPDEVGFVEGIPKVDREVFTLVEHELPGARFYPFTEIMDAGLPVGPHQRWISTRFHIHLIAAAAGAPGVAVSINSGYYTNKHRSLLDRGSNWELSEGLHVPTMPSKGGFDSDTVQELRESKANLARLIYGH